MKIYGADLSGIDGILIRFKATKEDDKRGVTLLGLAQKVVKEGFVRASKAIETLDGDWSGALNNQGYTVQLEPSETRKNSPGLDLPLAIMILQASVLQNFESLNDEIKKMEDSIEKLEGAVDKNEAKEDRRKRILKALESLRNQRENCLKYRKRLQQNKNNYLLIGTLDICTGEIASPEHGMFGLISCADPKTVVIVPEDAEVHAALISRGRKDINVYKASNLQEVWNVILGRQKPRPVKYSKEKLRRRKVVQHIPDLKDIDGVARAKRAMIIALAGGHNILLVGPPGQGKTMLSKAALKMLPDLSRDEMYDVNKIFSAKGMLKKNEVVLERPYQESQTNTTEAALFGGGQYGRLEPGIVSLAHKGILFFDEINLCNSNIIEKLRNTLNDRVYRMQRSAGTLEFPCSFIMVAAMNPCKCGWYGHFECKKCDAKFMDQEGVCVKHPGATSAKCRCSHSEIKKYRDKLSQPLLDRIDLKVMVSAHDDKFSASYSYATSTIQKEIQKSRDIQAKRYRDQITGNTNATVPDKTQYEKFNPKIPDPVINFFKRCIKEYDLTKRMEVKLLLVSRTISDLEGASNIRLKDMEEAVEVMGLSNIYFS